MCIDVNWSSTAVGSYIGRLLGASCAMLAYLFLHKRQTV